MPLITETEIDPAHHRVKVKENEKGKIPGPCQRVKIKALEHEGGGDTNRSWGPRNNVEEPEKEIRVKWKSPEEPRPSRILHCYDWR